jgi:AcrR family transcriptional regulator
MEIMATVNLREMPIETLSKQQLRTRETQARLLDAAEEIFVRDGYEAAQLDEIAARAERSKGAVYTHFESKEDLFLALFEHRTRTYIERLLGELRHCKSREESLKVFRDFYIGLASDRAWPILTLEFKLFALRHPESKERLRKAFEMSKPTHDGVLHLQVFGPLTREQKADIDLSLASLGPIVTGLILDSHFEPQMLSEKALRRIFGRIFDALISGGNKT